MTASISTWWEAMSAIEKVYWCVAIPASVLFIIQIITTFFIGDFDSVEADGDADVSVDSDSGIPFQFLSFKNLVAFFTIFGWVGIACLHRNLSIPLSIVIATVSGLAMMAVMATLMYFMGKLAESGGLELKNARGKTGTVYLTIPASRSGMGQIQINVQGFQTLDAMTDDPEAIPTGSLVQVNDVISNGILLVSKSYQKQ